MRIWNKYTKYTNKNIYVAPILSVASKLKGYTYNQYDNLYQNL